MRHLSHCNSSTGDFAEYQARVLRLSAEYRVLVCGVGGSDFPAYLPAHCPHLYSDFCLDFSSGSSRFLAALTSSASLPPPSSTAPSLPSSSRSPFPSAAPAFSSALLAPSARPSPSFAPSFPSAPLSVLSLAPHSVRCPPVSSSASQPFRAWSAVPGGSGVVSVVGSVAASFPVSPPVSAPSLFRPFAVDSSSMPVSLAPLPSFSSSASVYPGPSSAPAHIATTPSFIPPDELLRMLCLVISTQLFLL